MAIRNRYFASLMIFNREAFTRAVAKTSSWLTARRLRAQGLLLALCLWTVYLWNMTSPGLIDRAGNIKGTDFLHFYTLGSLALAHRGADLYHVRAQAVLLAQRVPQAAGTVYLPLYPPQVSLLFMPLALLSYTPALVLWLSFSSLIYGLCCYAFWRASRSLRGYGTTVLILAIAFPAFWHLIAWGQTSALALACFTVAYFALRARREFLAGVALGCLIFKPQLAVAAAIAFVFALRWQVVSAAILAAAAQLAAARLYYAPGTLRDWMRTLLLIPHMLSPLEPRLYQTHSLRTFWAMLLPWPSVAFGFYLLTAILVCLLTIACWRSHLDLSLRFSALLLATVLLAPHLTVYDLVILAPAFLLIADWIVTQPNHFFAPVFKLLLYFAMAAPLLAPVVHWIHFQPSVPVMAALLCGLWKIGRNSAVLTNSH